MDALRLDDTTLDDRGQLRIRPAQCAEQFRVDGLEWVSLKEVSAEPLLYQTLDTPPAPVLSPEEALAAFHIAPGFDITSGTPCASARAVDRRPRGSATSGPCAASSADPPSSP